MYGCGNGCGNGCDNGCGLGMSHLQEFVLLPKTNQRTYHAELWHVVSKELGVLVNV